VKVNLPKGASKSVKTRWHHKLADVKNGIATIDVTYQVLSPTDAGTELELVQRMMTGQVQFDIAKGRIQSQKMDVDKRSSDLRADEQHAIRHENGREAAERGAEDRG